MQKCGAPNGPNFAPTKEAAQGYSLKVLIKQVGVKVRFLVQAFTPPHTGKHQGSYGSAPGSLHLAMITGQQHF
jgi:hypothetical protein